MHDQKIKVRRLRRQPLDMSDEVNLMETSHQPGKIGKSMQPKC